MSTKVPSPEACAIYQAKIAGEATVVGAHHRVTVGIKKAVKAARGCILSKSRHPDREIESVHGTVAVANDQKAKVLVEDEGKWMCSFVGGHKLPASGHWPHASSRLDSPKVGKNKPLLLAADCTFLSNCDEETAEDKLQISRKVRGALALVQEPGCRTHTRIHHNDNDYIHYGRIDIQPTIVQAPSVRSEEATLCSWVSDVADCIDTDFELPELPDLRPLPTTCTSFAASEAWSASPNASVPSLAHSVTTKTSFASREGSDTPPSRGSSSYLPVSQTDDRVPHTEWDCALL